jgi:acylphosphatase
VDTRHRVGRDEEFTMTDKAADERRTVTVKIEGRVQGVYFRAWTYETAQSLGLDGTVRNASDGSVEAVFSGPAGAVAKMLKLCEDGPEDARVTKVTIMREGGSVAPGFKVTATDRWR